MKLWIIAVIGILVNLVGTTHASEVALLQAELRQTCSSAARIAGTILVKNIAYEKHVAVTIETAGEKPYTVDASYSHDLGGGYEMWTFETLPTTAQLINLNRFAIRYDAANQRFSDPGCAHGYLLDMEVRRIFGGQCRDSAQR